MNKSEIRVEGATCDIDAAEEVEEEAVETEIAEAGAAALELDKVQTDDGSEDGLERKLPRNMPIAEEHFEKSPPLTPEPKARRNDIGPDKKKKSRFSTPAFPVVPSGDPQAPY